MRHKFKINAEQQRELIVELCYLQESLTSVVMEMIGYTIDPSLEQDPVEGFDVLRHNIDAHERTVKSILKKRKK